MGYVRPPPVLLHIQGGGGGKGGEQGGVRYPWLDKESDSKSTARVQLVLSAAEQLLVPTLHLSLSGGGGEGARRGGGGWL